MFPSTRQKVFQWPPCTSQAASFTQRTQLPWPWPTEHQSVPGSLRPRPCYPLYGTWYIVSVEFYDQWFIHHLDGWRASFRRTYATRGRGSGLVVYRPSFDPFCKKWKSNRKWYYVREGRSMWQSSFIVCRKKKTSFSLWHWNDEKILGSRRTNSWQESFRTEWWFQSKGIVILIPVVSDVIVRQG